MKKPPKTAEPNPREHFAAALRAIFDQHFIVSEEYTEFGKEVAVAQYRAYTGAETNDAGEEEGAAHAPARHIPYGAQTIQGWVSGELLPTYAAMDALCRTLKIEYGTEDYRLQELDDRFENAVEWQETQPNQPTELTHAMNTSRKQEGLAYEILADKNVPADHEKYAKRWNGRLSSPEGKISQSASGLMYPMNGNRKTRPSKYLTHAMEGWTASLTPSLHALHDQALRERADNIWQAAERENDLGGMLKAIRIRHGEYTPAFGKRIALLAGREKPFVPNALHYWEANTYFPAGDHQHSNTLCEPYILAAKIADAAPNGLSRSIKAPWFTPEMERTLRDRFRCHVEKANKGHCNYEMPAYELSGTPDMKTIPSILKVIGGELNDVLINGISSR